MNDIKKEPLKLFYPLSMFIQDKLLWKFKLFNSEKVDKNLKAIYVKDKVDAEKELYKSRKISFCLSVFILLNIFGFIISAANLLYDEGNLEYLIRPEYGEGSKEYDVEVKINGEVETVNLKVEEKKYTEEEILKLYDDSYEDVIKKLLGENSSQEEIIYPLDFISFYEDFNISWKISDTELIDFSGNIYNKELKENRIVYITAEFSLEDVTKEFETALIVLPYVEKTGKSLEERIQENLDKKNKVHSESVKLPESIDDKKVVFNNAKENPGLKFLFAGILFSILVFILYDKELEKRIKKRDSQMLMDYSDIVSKLTLLMGAGMTISLAWERIVKDYERKKDKNKKRYAFEEMKLANTKIKSGVSESIAYREFGKRCSLQCYLKLASLLEQNLVKGTSELRSLLEGEVREAFENRKSLAKIKGEEAGTKLLLPMIIMLGIVIIIIIIPAFMSMNL